MLLGSNERESNSRSLTVISSPLSLTVAIGFALAGLCFGTCFEACTCIGKLSASMFLMVAAGCQAVTLLALATKPTCVFSGCVVGGPSIMAMCAIGAYGIAGVSACCMPTSGRNDDS